MKYLLGILLIFSSVHSCAGFFDRIQNFFLGRSYQVVQSYHQQNYDTSLQDLCQLMDHDPYNPQYNYNLGNVLYRQKKYDQAQQAFLRAAHHEKSPLPLQEQAFFNTGNCHYQLQQWQKAIDAYRQVLKINPENQPAQHNLQLALYKLKEEEMQDQSKQEDQQSQQDQQKKDQSSQDSKNCDGKGQGDQQGQQNQNEQSKSGHNPQRTPSQDSQSDQEQKKDQQQQGNNADQDDNVDGDGQDQGTEKSDQKDTEQTKQNRSSMQEGLDDQITQQDIADKNNQSLQDLAEKVENAGKNDQQEKMNEKQNFDQTHLQDDAVSGDDKKDMRGMYKKPELKNALQQQYENKASDDERLTDYHASVMKTLEELEEKIQKHVIKNKVAIQGAGQNGKKGW
jgi:Ca-activated chloride channel homolog